MVSILVAVLIVGFVYLVAGTKSVWFPAPHSWLKALVLAIPTWLGSVAIFNLEVWRLVLFSLYAYVRTYSIGSEPEYFFLALAGVLLAFLLIVYLLLVLLYRIFLRCLWAEIPRFLYWLKEPFKRKRDVLFSWLISMLALLIAAAPLILAAFDSTRDTLMETIQRLTGLTTQEILAEVFIRWYVAAAYLLQLQMVLKFRLFRRSPARTV